VRINKEFDPLTEKFYVTGLASFHAARKEVELVADYRLFWSETCSYETKINDLSPATEFGDILKFSVDLNQNKYQRYFERREVPFGALFFILVSWDQFNIPFERPVCQEIINPY